MQINTRKDEHIRARTLYLVNYARKKRYLNENDTQGSYLNAKFMKKNHSSSEVNNYILDEIRNFFFLNITFFLLNFKYVRKF